MDKMSKKLQILRTYCYGNMLSSYETMLDKSNMITPSEALELYKPTSCISGVAPSAFYYLLDENKQLEYIDDIYKFDEFSEDYYKKIKNPKILKKVIGRMIDLQIINEINAYECIERFEGDTKFVFEIINRIIYNAQIDRSSSFNLSSISILNNLSEEEKIKVYKNVIKNTYNQVTVPGIIKAIKTLSSQEQINELLIEIINLNVFNKLNYEKCEEYIFENLSLSERRFLVKYIIENDHKVKEVISLEEVFREYLEPKDAIEALEAGIKLNYKEIFQYNDRRSWIQAANCLKSLGKKGEEYLDVYFMSRGVLFLEEEHFDKLANNIIRSKRFTVKEKYAFLSEAFNVYTEDIQKLFEGINLLIKYEGVKCIDENFIELITCVNETTDIIQYSYLMEALKEKYSLKNDDNFEKYCKLFKNIGIEYLNNKNIPDLINLDSIYFDKTMNLFNEENIQLTESALNTVVNAFIQRKFRMDKEDVYNIFAKCERLLQNKNDYTITEIENIIKTIRSEVNWSKIIGNKDIDIDDLFEHKKESIDLLHKLTNAYIAKEREIYTENNRKYFYDNLNISKYYEKNYAKKAFFKVNEPYTIFHTLKECAKREMNFAKEELSLLLDYDSLSELIRLKKGEIKEKVTKKQIEKLNIMDGILDKMYDHRRIRITPLPKDAKYIYIMPEPSKMNLLEIIRELEPECLKEKNLNNEEAYSKLKAFINKYRVFGWDEVFDDVGNEMDIDTDPSMIGGLINNFIRIDQEINRKLSASKSLTAYIDYAMAYSKCSGKYSLLLGKENLEYIKKNPGPHSSSTKRKQRMDQAISFLKKIYERDCITVPSGEIVHTLKNNKEINISVGDVYDPIVLTYGERTKACLRIGGAFFDLFEYCLTNENGFHIRFTNPENGNFISRVSGFRNGNTIFLNELRYSEDEDYEDEDLVEALKEISKVLVEETKNDEYPIENVVVSMDFAMADQDCSNIRIGKRTDAFKGLSCNITGIGHVLYTSNENHKILMPYKFGDEFVSKYKPYNNKVSVALLEDAKEAINRVHALNELMKGKLLEDIEMLSIENVDRAIYGNGWVVYKDNKNIIHRLVIDKFRNDKALNELIDKVEKQYFKEKDFYKYG